MPSSTTLFTLSLAGYTREAAKVLRRQLAVVAADFGYINERGPHVGEGNVGQLLADLADGQLAVIEVDEELDPPFVAWLREQASIAARRDQTLEDNLLSVAAAFEAAFRRHRRRDREEMDALNANPTD